MTGIWQPRSQSDVKPHASDSNMPCLQKTASKLSPHSLARVIQPTSVQSTLNQDIVLSSTYVSFSQNTMFFAHLLAGVVLIIALALKSSASCHFLLICCTKSSVSQAHYSHIAGNVVEVLLIVPTLCFVFSKYSQSRLYIRTTTLDDCFKHLYTCRASCQDGESRTSSEKCVDPYRTHEVIALER